MATREQWISGASGAASGAAAGSAAGPWGAAAGGVVGAVSGFLTAPKKANIPEVPLVDVEMVKFKSELERTRDAIRSGVTPEFTFASDLINKTKAQSLDTITGVTGGDVGSALAGAEGVTRAAGANINSLYAGMTAQELGYSNLIANYITQMSQRKLGIQNSLRSQAQAQTAVATTESNAQLMSTIGSPAVMSMVSGGAEGAVPFIQKLLASKSQAPATAATPTLNTTVGSNGLPEYLNKGYGMGQITPASDFSKKLLGV